MKAKFRKITLANAALKRQSRGYSQIGTRSWTIAHLIFIYGNGRFDPTGDITREQLAAILYRYEQSKGGGFVGAWMFLLDYPDAAEISSWADEAMHWCVMNGIINGKDGKLVPGGDASRAEAATMLMRYCTKTAE